MNTIPYLTEEATASTLKEVHALLAPGSRIVLNYAANVPLTADQTAFLSRLAEVVDSAGEPTRSRFRPEDFETLLVRTGFEIVEHGLRSISASAISQTARTA